jgi:hypothetical protein
MPMMRLALLFAASLILTAWRCSGPEPIPAAPDIECLPPGYHFAFLDTDTDIYRQGATIRLTPKVDMSPAGTADLPPRCTGDWTVAGAATLAPDRRSLAIAADAPVGSVIEVGFRHAGAPVVGRMRVIAADAVVLTGRRSQQAIEGCDVPDPVRELEFRPENGFAVTFAPFETYRDYWGGYRFDPATGALVMTVTGGNFVPPGLDLEGRAELVGGRLVLHGMFLGSRQAAPPSGPCTYRF